VEFDGPGVANLTMDERLTVANMGIEMGAKIAVFPVDEAARDFLAAAGVVDFQALWADEGADYERVLEVDMGALEPVVAMPHTVDNVVSIGEAAGTPVHQLLLGTCTNGRLSDLAAAAAILRGKRIHSSVRLLVLPASRDILIEGMKSGVIADIVQAGGTLLPPGCGPCLGAHQGVLAPGERCLSTANRNFKGRMGCRDAEILLGSPETVAASALTGVVTDPREVQP
jgi:homoaconitase/3-isopropylmalate dehydratase large subunit